MTNVTEVEPTVEPVPTSDDLVALSQRHHLLCMPMFVMSTFPTDVGMAAVMEAVQEHLDYWAKLEEESVMFAGGPMLSEVGSDPWSGHGMIIFTAQSLAAAHAIAEADPMHASGARQYELRPWLLNHVVVPDGAKS
ncbi:YciI family protein [Streptomyces mirabilis]|uniref:YciI family protein n=1 Tax=Streptomyces mirabilis TaxID=68239 RepID=UPI00364BF84E